MAEIIEPILTKLHILGSRFFVSLSLSLIICLCILRIDPHDFYLEKKIYNSDGSCKQYL